MIHLFIKDYPPEQMLEANGDIVLNQYVSCYTTEVRNGIWFIEIEFIKTDLYGFELTNESVFKVALNFGKPQLFRMLYYTETSNGTYKCYATHVFFDSKFEVVVGDDRTVNKLWDGAIQTLNDIIATAKNNKTTTRPYKVSGVSSYTGYFEPDDTSKFSIRPSGHDELSLDISGASIDIMVEAWLYSSNYTVAQSFYFVKHDDGYWSIHNARSGRALNIKNGLATEGAGIIQYSLDGEGENEHFSFVSAGKDEYYIVSKIDKQYGLGVTSYSSQSNIKLTRNYTKFKLSNFDAYQTAYWQKYNLIECMFGDNENALRNRWPECNENHITAMFDNYHCYFGNDKHYPEALASSTYALATTRAIVDKTIKVSMENVATGIVPQAYNGKKLANGEIVKGVMWGKYRTNRIIYKEYSDIKHIDDASEDEKRNAYDTATLQAVLRERAKANLRKLEMKAPKVERSIKLVDIFGKESPYAEVIKVNDVLELVVDDDSGERERFYIEKIKLNNKTNRVEEITLSHVGEESEG